MVAKVYRTSLSENTAILQSQYFESTSDGGRDCCMTKMNKMASEAPHAMPRIRILRRVPTRYRRVLPLKIVRRYQCVVIGAAQGVLTVAITDEHAAGLHDLLTTITGQSIFPVLVDSLTMRLLIQRIERQELLRRRTICPSSFFHPHQAQTIAALLLALSPN